MNVIPTHDSPSSTPYYLWHGSHFDPLANPLLPFGSIVYAHIPLCLQTTLSGRSVRTFYIGCAPDHKSGILLFDPRTKLTKIRRTYKVLGPVDPAVTDTTFDLHPADNDADDELHPHQYGTDHGVDADPSVTDPATNVPVLPAVIPPGEYVVESIVGHKGTARRPSTMKFHVKWLGLDEYGWIDWEEADQLAALDVYLRNNPNVIVPPSIHSLLAAAPVHSVSNDRYFACNVHRAASLMSDIGLDYSDCSRALLTNGNDPRAAVSTILINRGLARIAPHMTSSFGQIFNYLSPKCIRAYPVTIPSVSLHAYSSVMSDGNTIPRSLANARSLPTAPYWETALRDELNSWATNSTWCEIDCDISLIALSLIVPSKFVFDVQYHPDGSFSKFKIRLVARGDRWIDIYGMSTYASTVKSESVRLILSIAAAEDMLIECVDVKTAFLYPPLKPGELIYMRRPKGLTDADMPAVVRLTKCVYGLPQASAYFRAHSDSTLRAFGALPTPEDDCVYTYDDPSGARVYICAHVDDFGLISKSQHALDLVKGFLAKTYALKVNADMSYYLGMLITRDRASRWITLSQPRYIADIADRFHIDMNAQIDWPVTPMVYDSHRRAAVDITPLPPAGIVDYQSRIGSLLYLAINTRPDILYAMSMLSRKSKAPSANDLSSVNRVLLYVVGSRHLALKFYSTEGVKLYATVDASYACHPDFKSHSGCALQIGR